MTYDTTPGSTPGEDNICILIAEDSPTQAERLRYVLERRGYKVQATTNGKQALAAARENKPTLIISDIVMPEMDGYQLCQQVKADPSLSDVPVILVTTLSDPQDVICGLACRADNFVVKPYDEQYLISRIQFVLQNCHRRQTGDGIEVVFNEQRHLITADRHQILTLLLSTYDAAMQRNRELTQTKDMLRDANGALEASNRELEAFSYSVSHDLRAPLRAIEGYTRSLAEDYAATFDDEGRALLARTQKSCVRMRQLIEDLLELSRIGRSELHVEQVDISALAKTVAKDLSEANPASQVAIKIETGLQAMADARLLRIALENLLGNAWKFSSKVPQPVVEVGAAPGSASTFFVRDNGAGFDMAFAKKLFGAFQRLHSAQEFPGTGIGLAIVQRIMARHNGKIWAQSAAQGATFFFQL